MRFLKTFVAAALIASTTPANAAWYEAKSKHFVIYADGRPKALTDFASRLERFDQAARALLKADDPSSATATGSRSS